MLSIFKKKEKPEVLVIGASASDLAKTVINSYPKDVIEIHNEFNTAAEKLLLQAKSIIKEAESKDTGKVSRLEALGFSKVSQVIELKPLLQQSALSKEQIELVNYYKFHYPLNKFITEEQVKAICHKYNLVCGDVSRFTGFVPEKNLKDIENFKLKKAERNMLVSLEGLVFEDAEIKKTTEFGYYHIYKIGSKDYAFQSNDGIRFYGHDKKNIFGYKNLPDNISKMASDPTFATNIVIGNALQICAPVKDMDITGLELTEGYKLQKKHIPDPVVLQPVKGGYLILTAWGPEASDPMVVNENNN